MKSERRLPSKVQNALNYIGLRRDHYRAMLKIRKGERVQPALRRWLEAEHKITPGPRPALTLVGTALLEAVAIMVRKAKATAVEPALEQAQASRLSDAQPEAAISFDDAADQVFIDVAFGLARMEYHLHADNGLSDGRIEDYAIALDRSWPVLGALENLRKLAPLPSIQDEEARPPDDPEIVLTILAGRCFFAGFLAGYEAGYQTGWKAALANRPVQ